MTRIENLNTNRIAQRTKSTIMVDGAIYTPLFLVKLWFVFALLVYSLIAPLIAQADDSQQNEWHYTLRPGDRLQDVSESLLARQFTWTDIVRHNKIENVASLAPGSIIKVPMHWLKHQPKPAKVISISGSAFIKRASQTKFKPLKEDARIRVGDEVSTRKGSVLIEFADGSTIRLDPESNLVFNKLSHFGKTGMVDTRLRLKKGSLSTEVTPLVKGSRYEITTPSAVAAVRGTEFRIEAKPNETKLEVIEGEVEFSGKHGKALVTAGNGATIKQGTTQIQQQKLPEPPAPMFAQQSIDDLPATLEWEDSKKTGQYRVQITDNSNQQVIKNKTLTKPEVELTHIENGKYDVAMRSIDSEGFEGPDSRTDLSVDIGSEKPLLIAPLDKSILDTAYPSFAWKLEGGASYGKVEVAKDSSFSLKVSNNEFIPDSQFTQKEKLLPGTYFWRVAALADDAEITYSDARQFAIKGLLAPVEILSVNYIDSQVGLFWRKIDNTQGYVLQISDSPTFDKILKEQTLGKARAHLKLNAGKKYYARVRGIGSDLFTAQFGPVKELMLDE